MTDQPQIDPRRSPLQRFLGGHPLNVVLKLAFISLLVGFAMSVLGLDAQSVVRGSIDLVRSALRDGLGLFEDVGGYILTGAALVVPIWLLMRLLKAR